MHVKYKVSFKDEGTVISVGGFENKYSSHKYVSADTICLPRTNVGKYQTFLRQFYVNAQIHALTRQSILKSDVVCQKIEKLRKSVKSNH